VPAALLALAALRQLSALLFSVANKPVVVCAWLVLGAAVPWNLYRLKSDKRNLDWRIVCRFVALIPDCSLLPCETKGRIEVRVSMFAFQIRDEFFSLPSPRESEASLRRCAAHSIVVWRVAVASLKS
jgi:hypothetical protein